MKGFEIHEKNIRDCTKILNRLNETPVHEYSCTDLFVLSYLLRVECLLGLGADYSSDTGSSTFLLSAVRLGVAFFAGFA